MALPIDFSVHSPDKPFANASALPFLNPNFSRYLSSMSDQKLPRFLGNISNPMFWRQFPPYFQYDQKLPFNAALFDQIASKPSRTRPNPLQMSSSRLFSPPTSFFDKFRHCKSSGSNLPTLFDNWTNGGLKDKTTMPQNPTLMIHLQSGVKKRLEEITEFDLWHCTKDNDQFSPQWSEVVQICPLADEKKVEITFVTNNKQIVYPTDVHRPFFVKNLGWCSMFPAITQKIFGIQCSMIDIGHCCLTLSRKRKSPHTDSDASSSKRCKESPRSHGSYHLSKL